MRKGHVISMMSYQTLVWCPIMITKWTCWKSRHSSHSVWTNKAAGFWRTGAEDQKQPSETEAHPDRLHFHLGSLLINYCIQRRHKCPCIEPPWNCFSLFFQKNIFQMVLFMRMLEGIKAECSLPSVFIETLFWCCNEPSVVIMGCYLEKMQAEQR